MALASIEEPLLEGSDEEDETDLRKSHNASIAVSAGRAASSAVDRFNTGFVALMGDHYEDRGAIDELWQLVNSKGGARLFFEDLKFDKEAGFTEVRKLTHPDEEGGQSWPMRSMWALAAVFFVVYNTKFIVGMSSSLGCSAHDLSGYTGKRWMLTHQLLSRLANLTGSRDLESFIHNCDTVWVIHSIELLMLLVVYIRLIRNIILAVIENRSIVAGIWGEKVEVGRWIALVNIFWRNIPDLATVSGMRVLNIFQSSQLSYEMKHNTQRTAGGAILFFIKLAACFIYGIDCFLVKFRAVIPVMEASVATDWFHYISQVAVPLIFARQLASIVDIPKLVSERLFRFIFAGQDSVMQSDERAKKDVWNAMMVKSFWQRCFTDAKESSLIKSSLKFAVLMLSFNDGDFQMLVLDVKMPEIYKRNKLKQRTYTHQPSVEFDVQESLGRKVYNFFF